MQPANIKNKPLIIGFIIITSIFFPLFPELSKAEHFLFENGLELSIIKDNKNPLASIHLEICSGYTDTEKNEAGLFEISQNLFWNYDKKASEKEKEIGISNTQAKVLANKTEFSASFPAHSLKAVLDLLQERIENRVFSQESLAQIIAEYKASQKALVLSPYGLIHGTIIQELYPENPWAQTPEMHYFYFTDKKIESFALSLKKFKEKYYQAKNIRIEIQSPYENEIVLAIAKNHLENWENKFEKPSKQKPKNNQKAIKKLVLLSQGFPENLEQFIFIRIIDSELEDEASFLSFLLEENIENVKTQFCESPHLSLENEEFLAFSFEKGLNNSRFISQYMSKKNNTSILEKIEEIQRLEKEIDFSSQAIESIYPYFHILKENTEKNNEKPDFLNKGFFDFANIDSSIFILLNPKNFANYKKSIEENNWQVINEKDFQKNIQEKLHSENTQEIAEKTEIPNYKNLFESQENEKSLIKLSNGIPVFMLLEPNSETVKVDFIIDYSTIEYSKKTFLIDEIIFRLLEEQFNTQNFENMLQNKAEKIALYRKTTKNETRFSFETNSETIYTALYDFISLFVFFNINPFDADRLNMQIQNETRIEKASLNRQIYLAALETLFDKNNYAYLFYDKAVEITFDDIQKRLTSLYNAESIKIALMGKKLELATVYYLCEKTLSFLQKREKSDTRTPIFTMQNVEKKVQLSHLFTSTIDAKDAGPRPVKLIPTKEFFDPLHIYFQKPKDENEVFFDTIVYAISEILNETNAKKNFGTIKYYEDENIEGLAIVEFTQVKNYNKIKKSLDNAFSLFPQWIRNEKNLLMLKNYWINEEFSQINTISIEKQIALRESLIKLETAQPHEFLRIFNRFIRNANALWLISKDTKK